LVDALNVNRGKRGRQRVTVKHVHVYQGGQAVVGVIDAPGGGGGKKSEEQPHERQVAHAPEPALPSPDAGGNAMPIGGHEERPVPISRGRLARRTDGE
jgi:hypothetical protein